MDSSALTRVADHAYTERSKRLASGVTAGPKPQVAAQRAVQDAVLAERHHEFDLKAQDHTMKYERFHFAVVGEGTKSANDAYREGWERIFGSNK